MLMLTYSDHHRLGLGVFRICVIFDELLYRYQQNPANGFFLAFHLGLQHESGFQALPR